MNVEGQTFKVKTTSILNITYITPTPPSVIGSNYPTFYTGIFVLLVHANKLCFPDG